MCFVLQSFKSSKHKSWKNVSTINKGVLLRINYTKVCTKSTNNVNKMNGNQKFFAWAFEFS